MTLLHLEVYWKKHALSMVSMVLLSNPLLYFPKYGIILNQVLFIWANVKQKEGTTV